MATRGSRKVVRVAIIANLAIAGCKYLAAAFTHSPVMLAEAVHSTADTGNELLLLLGMKRSIHPPDALHPFGYGKALYFYSLLVAVYIFGVGGGFAFYQGISHLHHPVPTTSLSWNYAVLALGAVFDYSSWRISYRELFSRKNPEDTTWDVIVNSKDPTIFTVFLEDSAALVGTFLAFLAILLGQLLHNQYLDPLASILIGILLGAVATLLGRESGALLVGERTSRATINRVAKVITDDPAVERVGELLTMQLGPDQVLLAVNIKFHHGLDVQQLESSIDRIENQIHVVEPAITRIFIEADALKEVAQPSPHPRIAWPGAA